MGKRGRPRQPDNNPTPLEKVEAFCCAQTERIERTLARTYGRDYDGHTDGREAPGNKSYFMPTNDHFTRHRLMTECLFEGKK